MKTKFDYFFRPFVITLAVLSCVAFIVLAAVETLGNRKQQQLPAAQTPPEQLTQLDFTLLLAVKGTTPESGMPFSLLHVSTNPEKIQVLSLPGESLCGNSTLQQSFYRDGPEKALQQIEKMTGITPTRYIVFSTESALSFTKEYGDVSHYLENEISYYNPANQESLLFEKGWHKFNGMEMLKLIQYLGQKEGPQAAASCASALLCEYVSQNLTGRQQGLDKNRFIRFLDQVQTNITAYDYEHTKLGLRSLLCGEKKQAEETLVQGTYNSSKGSYILPAGLKESFTG